MSNRHADEFETEEAVQRKRQKWLRGKLTCMDNKPKNFNEVLCAVCKITPAELLAIECTTGESAVLEKAKLDAVENFIQRVTSRAWEFAKEHEEWMGTLEGSQAAEPPTACSLPSASNETGKNEHAPTAEPAQEVTFSDLKRGDEKEGVTITTRSGHPLEPHEHPRYREIVRRWSALPLPWPHGFIKRFRKAADLKSSDVHAMNHGFYLCDIDGKYDRIEQALTRAEQGEFRELCETTEEPDQTHTEPPEPKRRSAWCPKHDFKSETWDGSQPSTCPFCKQEQTAPPAAVPDSPAAKTVVSDCPQLEAIKQRLLEEKRQVEAELASLEPAKVEERRGQLRFKLEDGIEMDLYHIERVQELLKAAEVETQHEAFSR